jgi:hypothetical protein
MESLPIYIHVVFIITVAATVFIFYKATNRSLLALIILLVWLCLQGIIAGTGFYTYTQSLPPRFALALFPPLFSIAILFITKGGRTFIDKMDLRLLTWLHAIRIPIEVVLLWLFIYKTIPQIMTFEGKNFDILSGISAPLVYYFVFVKSKWSKTVLLFWNFFCLVMLANIVSIAIVAAPFPFQKIAFNQPNISILYAPFIWLPSVVVPIVLLAHLVAIRQLVLK